MTLSNQRKIQLNAKIGATGWNSSAKWSDAFEALFQQHWERLCTILYRLVGDWDEAQDLALEAFVQYFRRPPKREDNPSGWLYRVATRLGLNALRSRRRRRAYETRLGPEEDNSLNDPALEVELEQERAHVRQILSDMPPHSAQLLLLRYSDFSYAEIALALEISPGSVGTLLARAEREFERRYAQDTTRPRLTPPGEWRR